MRCSASLRSHRALAAFLARSLRCAGVINSARTLPPFSPPILPCSRKKANAARESLFSVMLNPVCYDWTGFRLMAIRWPVARTT